MGIAESRDQMRSEYSKYTARRFIFIALFVILAIILFFVSLGVGTRSLSFSEVYDLFISHLQGATYDRTAQY